MRKRGTVDDWWYVDLSSCLLDSSCLTLATAGTIADLMNVEERTLAIAVWASCAIVGYAMFQKSSTTIR